MTIVVLYQKNRNSNIAAVHIPEKTLVRDLSERIRNNLESAGYLIFASENKYVTCLAISKDDKVVAHCHFSTANKVGRGKVVQDNKILVIWEEEDLAESHPSIIPSVRRAVYPANPTTKNRNNFFLLTTNEENVIKI